MTEPKKQIAAPAAKPGLEDLEALRRSEQAGAHVMAARNARRKGEGEAAKALLKQAFAVSPGDMGALDLLGEIYMEEGETEKAANLYERALKLYPKHPPFEEKLALCHLDLAQMESDKLAREMLISGQLPDLGDELVPSKAATLSLFLPGAGQFYNDEGEKGIVFLGAAILSCLSWFYPLWTALSNVPTTQRFAGGFPNFGAAYATLGGGWTVVFWIGFLLWLGVYIYSMMDAAGSARAQNQARRQALGL